MKIKQILALLVVIACMVALTACGKDDEKAPTDSNTVTGGNVADVFGLNNEATDGEDVTVDATMIDGDSGEVVVASSTSNKDNSKPSTAVKHDIKQETTLASNSVSSAATESGFKLSWAAVNGAKSYNIYRAEKPSTDYKFIANTTATSYLDKTGSNKYTYKVTVAPAEKPSAVTPSNSSGFKGSTVQFNNENKGTTFISSNLNNAYIAYIRSEYAKNGINCPPGRLAYVQISGQDYLYVFQFDNTKKWNGNTLEQVHIFVDKNDRSKYFSFFTKDNESADYMKAKKTATSKWNSMQGSDGTPYNDMQALLITLADDPHFQSVIDASY